MTNDPLPPDYNNLSVGVLRSSTRKKLDQTLNESDAGGIDVGIAQLANVLGFSDDKKAQIQQAKTPTAELLDCWQNDGHDIPATIGKLYEILRSIQRESVFTACINNIKNDCRMFDEASGRQQPQQPMRVVSYPEGNPLPEMPGDDELLTIDDVKTGSKTKYYGFVSYAPNSTHDFGFVREIIHEIEVKRKLKVFVPGRDDLPGTSTHSTNAYLMEQRCRRVILVISNAFLQSSACDFHLRFAQSICPGARGRKLVPVIIEPLECEYPRILLDLHKCDFTVPHLREWTLDQLVDAIKAPAGEYKLFEEEEGSDTEWFLDSISPSVEYPRFDNCSSDLQPEFFQSALSSNIDTRKSRKSENGVFARIKRFVTKKT